MSRVVTNEEKTYVNLHRTVPLRSNKRVTVEVFPSVNFRLFEIRICWHTNRQQNVKHRMQQILNKNGTITLC